MQVYNIGEQLYTCMHIYRNITKKHIYGDECTYILIAYAQYTKKKKNRTKKTTKDGFFKR